MAARSENAWKVQRSGNAEMPVAQRQVYVGASLHARNVAHIVVRVGPPMRMTMFRAVAIGRSSRLTEEYAAEIEGTPGPLRSR